MQVSNAASSPPVVQLAEVHAVSAASTLPAAQQLAERLPVGAAGLPLMLAHNLQLRSQLLTSGALGHSSTRSACRDLKAGMQTSVVLHRWWSGTAAAEQSNACGRADSSTLHATWQRPAPDVRCPSCQSSPAPGAVLTPPLQGQLQRCRLCFGPCVTAAAEHYLGSMEASEHGLCRRWLWLSRGPAPSASLRQLQSPSRQAAA